jgi:hypothetical protein
MTQAEKSSVLVNRSVPMAAFLVFAISPVMSLIVLVAAAVLGVGILGTMYERLGFDLTEDGNRLGTMGSAMLNDMLSLLTIVIPSIVATAFYCHLGKRSHIGGKWVLLSSALLAAIASGACFWRAAPGRDEWCFGICWSGFLATGQWNCLLQHLVELIAPLAAAWWFLRRHRDEGYLQLSTHGMALGRAATRDGMPSLRRFLRESPDGRAARIPQRRRLLTRRWPITRAKR